MTIHHSCCNRDDVMPSLLFREKVMTPRENPQTLQLPALDFASRSPRLRPAVSQGVGFSVSKDPPRPTSEAVVTRKP